MSVSGALADSPWKALRLACDGLERICQGTADETGSSSIAEKALYAAIGMMDVADIDTEAERAAAGMNPVEAARLAVAENWQPRVDNLRALLDAATTALADTSLPSEITRAQQLREQAGLPAPTITENAKETS